MTLDELRAQATLREGAFRAWDTMAVELEVAELLYALVRQTKPTTVVEGGTGNGYAARFIAEALAENGAGGALATYEHDLRFATHAAALLHDLPARVIHGYSYDHDGPAPQLVFIDSLGDFRDRDIRHWLDPDRGDPLIVIHDANGYSELADRADTGGVLLPAGRGVWIGRPR